MYIQPSSFYRTGAFLYQNCESTECGAIHSFHDNEKSRSTDRIANTGRSARVRSTEQFTAFMTMRKRRSLLCIRR